MGPKIGQFLIAIECFVACARADYRGKMAESVHRRAKVTNQMRLSNPLLLLSLGIVLAAVSCTLITDVDRSKIPDPGGEAGSPGNGGGAPNGGTNAQPQGGEGGSAGNAMPGGGEGGNNPGGAGEGGAPEGGAAGSGGSPGGAGPGAGGADAGAGGTMIGAAGGGGAP
jgi:hypothetical protein